MENSKLLEKLSGQLVILNAQMKACKEDRDISSIKELSPVIKALNVKINQVSDLVFIEENGMTREKSREIASRKIFSQVLHLCANHSIKNNPYDSSIVDAAERISEAKANW